MQYPLQPGISGLMFSASIAAYNPVIMAFYYLSAACHFCVMLNLFASHCHFFLALFAERGG